MSGWSGWFTDEHGRRLGLAGRATLWTLLHLVEARGQDGAVTTSVSELAGLAGGKRETIRTVLKKHEGVYWTVTASGERVRPLRVTLAEIGQAGGQKRSGLGGRKRSPPGRDRSDGPAGIGHPKGPRLRLPGEKQKKPLGLGSPRYIARESSSKRVSHEWRKAVRIMDELKFNGATRRRITGCPLSDAKIYRLVHDAREGGKGPGWVWEAIKRIVREGS